MKNNPIKRKKMVYGIEDIKSRLPHRYPFLMIDRIIEQSPGECIGIKNITFDESYFLGHFPDQSIMPGTLIAEAMAQTAGFVGQQLSIENQNNKIMRKGFLTSMNIKIHQPVIPGDQLLIKVKVVKKMGALTKFVSEATVDDNIVASSEFTIAEVE